MSRTIFIVEDDENIRQMVNMALSSFSYEVRVFDNAEDGLAAIYANIPDMIILDIMLPGMSGLDATKELRGRPETKHLPIILLTAKDSEIDKVVGLDYGADDYISKPFGVMELGARVRSLFRRIAREDESVIEELHIGNLYINNSTRELTQDGNPIDLTFKEFELLYLLMREADRILAREELLNRLWGYDFLGESRTLDIHIRSLRQKLGDDADNPKYIKTIRNVGYRFIGE